MKQKQTTCDAGCDFSDFVLDLEKTIGTLKAFEAGKSKKSLSLRLTEDELQLIDVLYERTCCVMDLMPNREIGETKYPSKRMWLKAVLFAGLADFRERCRMFREEYE